MLPWNPNADLTVWAIAVSRDGSSVFAGGSFQNVGGLPAYGWPRSTARTGALDAAWDTTGRCDNAGNDAGISSLRVPGQLRLRHHLVFGPGGNLEGTFKVPGRAAPTPDVEWVTDCHGDNYSSVPGNGIVYTAGHAHYCGNMGGGFPQYPQWRFQMAQAWTDTRRRRDPQRVHGYPNWHGVEPGPSMINWLPDAGDRHLHRPVPGRLERHGQRRLRRLRRGVPAGQRRRPAGPGPVRPARHRAGAGGPAVRGTPLAPRLVPHLDRPAVRVTWPAGWDRDDYNLTYRVIRNGAFGTPLHDHRRLQLVDVAPARLRRHRPDTRARRTATRSSSTTRAATRSSAPLRPSPCRTSVPAATGYANVGAQQRRPDLLADERDVRR